MSGILKSFVELMKGVGSSARVLELIELPPAVPRRPAVVEPPNDERFQGDIQFTDVHFAYPDRPAAPVLRGLTLTIKANESLALVGHSGSGKSTIASLLMRFHTPSSGSITVGRTPLHDLPHHHWMARIGLVSQDAMLFGGTIADNLRLARPDASMAEIVECCVLANADAFITQLPQGYDTVVTSNTSLSGGQRQRLSIARTLLHRPQVLLLDEPTSALDWKSEKLVRQGLDKAMEGRTTIIISHRASTLLNVDRIAVLHNGQVSAVGTHDELMAEPKGWYRRLVTHT